MTVRSVLEIDVKDERFKKYLDLFQDYQDQLGKMPGFWTDASKAAEGTATASSGLADALAVGAASTALITEALSKAEAHAVTATHTMATMAGHARDIASSILHATVNLAKWGTLSLGAGLLGGGVGLFGLDALANAVSGQRKSALGLGVTTAEQQAFNINFGSRLVGGDFLSGVQGIKSDLAQQWQFSQLGIPAGEVQGADTAQLGIDVIRRAQQLWQQAGPGGHNVQWMQAHGLGDFMDFATWQRIGQASPGDIAGYASQYGQDVGTMGAPDATQRAWQDFSIQMHRAATQIEAVFVRGLEPLVRSEALPKLSAAVEKALAGFLGNPHMQEWVDGLARAISAFGDYLGSEQFGRDVKTVADDMGYLADKLVSALRLLGLLPPTPEAGKAAETPGTPDYDREHTGTPGYGYSPGKGWHWFPGAAGSTGPGDLYTPNATELDAVRAIETGNNPNQTSPTGAQGPYQFMPQTWAQYGHGSPFDPVASRDAAKRYLNDMLKKYKGNVAEALAAYNWGPQNVDNDLLEHPGDWMRFAPRETQNYIKNFAGRIHVDVSVLNQTGAQVAVLANAVQQ